MNWQQNLLTNITEIANLLNETRTIAVLGIKTEAQARQPAFYVPSYLQTAGFQIIPGSLPHGGPPVVETKVTMRRTAVAARQI